MQVLYEIEKFPGKVHPANTCFMQNSLDTKGIFILQPNVHDSRHAWMYNNNSILFLKMGIKISNNELSRRNMVHA